MTNITKLYEVAGVELEYYAFHSADGNIYKWVVYENGTPQKQQRTFTAEKQLELIKWLVCNVSHLEIYNNKDFYFTVCLFKGGKHKDFSQTLAGLILQLWDELTDTQKEEIKEILQ